MQNKTPINLPLEIPVVTTKLAYDSSLYVDTPILNGFDALSIVERHIADAASECAFIIACDSDFRPLCVSKVGVGSQIKVDVSVRDIVRTSLLCNANSVIFVHNHPYKDDAKTKLSPSKQDIELTHNLAKILPIVDILLYDSVIVQSPINGKYLTYSMREKSLFSKKWIPTKQKELNELMKVSDKLEDIPWQEPTVAIDVQKQVRDEINKRILAFEEFKNNHNNQNIVEEHDR